MKFDYCLGNPPYQDTTLGDNDNFAPSVFNSFMDAAYTVSDKVELITPAKFLFNAGNTPKSWNEKMLQDEHLKVLKYEPDSSEVFPKPVEIKGGVAITYRDATRNFGKIGLYTEYKEMNDIIKKAASLDKDQSISSIGVSGYSYHFTEKMHEDFPSLKTTTYIENGKEKPLLSKGHEYDLKSNIIEKLPMVFHNTKPGDNKKYIIIVGRENNERANKYIRREYINSVVNLDAYKVFIPKASGIGEFGEILGPSFVAAPGMGHTETFFSIGNFSKQAYAENMLKYLKGKFARAFLSLLKKTQNITPGNFEYVPLQDFTDKSDIDWSKSIHEIDLQLYKKYNLSQEEIKFIESHVKEME